MLTAVKEKYITKMRISQRFRKLKMLNRNHEAEERNRENIVCHSVMSDYRPQGL